MQVRKYVCITNMWIFRYEYRNDVILVRPHNCRRKTNRLTSDSLTLTCMSTCQAQSQTVSKLTNGPSKENQQVIKYSWNSNKIWKRGKAKKNECEKPSNEQPRNSQNLSLATENDSTSLPPHSQAHNWTMAKKRPWKKQSQRQKKMCEQHKKHIFFLLLPKIQIHQFIYLQTIKFYSKSLFFLKVI